MKTNGYIPNTWITHLPHLLDETGNIPSTVSASTLELVNAVCSFVAYASNFSGEMHEEFPPCFVTINNGGCPGTVFPCLTIDEKIAWQCKTCGSGGIISGWQGTLWDLSERDQLQ